MPGRYSHSELEAMLAEDESQLAERKRSPSDGEAIRRNICAFSNDLPGLGKPGVIFVGIENDGSCAGLPVTDEVLLNLANMRDDGNLQPLPSLEIEKCTLLGCTIALILVQPSLFPPMRYRGRVYVKVGPSVRLATADEELRLVERHQAAHIPFDMRTAPGTRLEDLDLEYATNQYLPSAVALDIREQNQRPLHQQLRSLRLAEGSAVTWGALLGIGRDPQSWVPGAYVQFVRVDGSDITDPILDQKQLTGRIGDILHALDEIVKLNITFRTTVAGQTRELRQPDYPFPALQQLVRNAVMHRTYEGTNAPVRIYWYSDRIQITSPGSLYGKVNPENFGKGGTDYRNPLVAEIMHHLGFAQRFGLGIPLARRELDENGNPEPEFEFLTSHVAVTVRPAR